MILQRFAKWMLYDVMGWKKLVSEEHPDKFIFCVAPHTSNMDFIIGQLYAVGEGIKCNFLMKKDWFFWPMGILMRKLGGIPVVRSKKMKMTEYLANKAKEADTFRLCITPEGTRSRNADWKLGFYYIALGAGIPILLYGIDFEKKLIQCTRTFVPTGDVEKDMAEIKQYFKDFKGKHPEKFTIGEG